MSDGQARSPNPEDVVTIDKSLLGTPQYREKLLFDVVVVKSQKQHCVSYPLTTISPFDVVFVIRDTHSMKSLPRQPHTP